MTPRPEAPDLEELARLRDENARLRARLSSAQYDTAKTLARATRLSQVISVLAGDADYDALVERVAVEVAELYSADVAVLMLGPDETLTVQAHYGLGGADVPHGPFAVQGLEALTASEPVAIGTAAELGVPVWLEHYCAEHVAWARLLVGEQSLGVLLLARRAEEPFERSDGPELRAIGYRVALAMENSLLHRGMGEQLVRLHRIQVMTAQLAGTLELDAVGRLVAEMLVAEVHVAASVLVIDRDGDPVTVARKGWAEDAITRDWERFPLVAGGEPVGFVAVADPPREGSPERELLLHLLGLSALALDKALLYEQSLDLARRDSLTGLLGHRVFHEQLEDRTAREDVFSLVLLDIDDFKSINDLYGHQTGDDALRLVADALRDNTRANDAIYRVGGEEFCVVMPGLDHEAAFAVAERVRAGVADIVSALPVTISLGVASFPEHARRRDELLGRADAALYVSKRGGKNRTTVAGADPQEVPGVASADRHIELALLHDRDPDTVVHSVHVATIAVDLARALGVEDGRLADLRLAAKLHDIGKIAVKDEILNKRGSLDEDEFRIVQTHPVVGAELLRAWGLEGPARFVLQHHEHVDGTGYPSGLSGEEIALESRIIHVADAYVAMTLDRPYRRAMEREEALEELVRHRGTQFDPGVVDAMLSLDRSRLAEALA